MPSGNFQFRPWLDRLSRTVSRHVAVTQLEGTAEATLETYTVPPNKMAAIEAVSLNTSVVRNFTTNTDSDSIYAKLTITPVGDSESVLMEITRPSAVMMRGDSATAVAGFLGFLQAGDSVGFKAATEGDNGGDGSVSHSLALTVAEIDSLTPSRRTNFWEL